MMGKTEEINMHGVNLILLTLEDFKACVNTEDGCNVCMLQYKDKTIIPFQKERFEEKRTYGIPILFPTPNRTRDQRFTFEGVQSDAVMHGLVKNSAFTVTRMFSNAEEAGVTAYIEIAPGDALYSLYPYHCRLSVTISVSSHCLNYQFEVCNLGRNRMPFGIALHPFFHLNMQEAEIIMDADTVMEKDEAFLPTGKLIRTEKTKFDLRTRRRSRDFELDDVYLCKEGNPKALIQDDTLKISVNASDFFSHMVVYTPLDAPFLCIEPQSCSTDAINLFTKGYEELSGLCVLGAGERKHTKVSFTVIL